MSVRTIKGTVVSAKMQKTVVVAIENVSKHSLYSKAIKDTKRIKTRNEMDVKEGSTVMIQETKPFSREVTWKVVEVLK